MPSYTKGRIIGFILGVVFVFLLWGYVFTPNGLWANVVLGLAVAILFIYMMTTNLGPFLDDYFFHGGSKNRALALRRAEQTAKQIANKVKSTKRMEKSKVESCQKAVRELLDAVNSIRKKHSSDPKAIESDIRFINDLESKAEKIYEEAVGKGFQKSGLFSGWFSLALALMAALALRAFIIEPYQIPSGSMIPTLLVGDHLFVSKLSYGIMNPLSSNPQYLVRWDTPKPGEVIIFKAPPYVIRNAGETWIKRVIAGPGQTIEIKDSIIYVDGTAYPQTKVSEEVNYSDFVNGEWKRYLAKQFKEKIGGLEHDVYQKQFLSYEERNWSRPLSRSNEGLICEATNCKVKEGYVFVMGDNRGHSSDGRYWGAVPIDNIKGRALFIWISVDGSDKSLDLGRFTLPAFRWDRTFQGIK